MTYTGEMVLPRNAVAMNTEEMRYVNGGALPAVVVGLLKAAAVIGVGAYVTSWDSNGKLWKVTKKGAKKYKIYWKRQVKQTWKYYKDYYKK